MRTGVKITTGPLVRLCQRAGGYFSLEAPRGSPKGVEGGERGKID